MDEIYNDVLKIFQKPDLVGTFVDIMLCAMPIWVAVLVGLLIGWSWRPRWTGLIFLGLRGRFRYLWTAPPGFGARRLWLAVTALSAFSVCRKLWENFNDKRDSGSGKNRTTTVAVLQGTIGSITSPVGEILVANQGIVAEEDLEYLLNLLQSKASEPAWQHMMDRSTTNLVYQAWRHEPEVGPVIYRSRTVFEDVTPELVRDFFWDDEFRARWDPMLSYHKTLEECPQTGAMVVHWIKKFPFFCSDREYIIGRRIWESSRTYFCVTKGVHHPGVPKREKPRRVELYYSSWCIRAVESCKGDGQQSACEVILFHFEDMGIPRDVAKLGLRQGMWGAVKKLHAGMRSYQLARKIDIPLSKSCLMAHVTIKVPDGSSISLAETFRKDGEIIDSCHMDRKIPLKWLIIGGTLALICSLHTGAFRKALLFGAARRLARK